MSSKDKTRTFMIYQALEYRYSEQDEAPELCADSSRPVLALSILACNPLHTDKYSATPKATTHTSTIRRSRDPDD
ncbi:hypothetical protein VNI00_017916 [Paramarasmius palmivorus]|uniref:Uncharacterized protein n=1 Tax=Paramarasmius palmivorus TaxID=297713 RepID=A0AAW0B1D9_9AGAR